MDQFSRWMQVAGVDVSELTGDFVVDFLGTMRDAGAQVAADRADP